MDVGVDGGMDVGVDGEMDVGVDGEMDVGVDDEMDVGVSVGVGTGVTVIFCWACGAARYLSFPAWLASMTHSPGSPKVTASPKTAHTSREPELKVTGLPEPPPFAVTT